MSVSKRHSTLDFHGTYCCDYRSVWIKWLWSFVRNWNSHQETMSLWIFLNLYHHNWREEPFYFSSNRLISTVLCSWNSAYVNLANFHWCFRVMLFVLLSISIYLSYFSRFFSLLIVFVATLCRSKLGKLLCHTNSTKNCHTLLLYRKTISQALYCV